MKQLQAFMATLALVLGLSSLTFAPAGAINVFDTCSSTKNEKTDVCKSTSNDNVNSLVQNIITTLLFVIGAVSVIMIIIGGIRYTLSNGDASQIKSAKDTTLYAIIGLVVALLAYAIVNFVTAQFK